LALFVPRGETRISDPFPAPVTPFLSVVIPAYNEERRLPPTLDRLLKYLHRQSYTWEVVVVVNGSTDGTARVAFDAARKFSRVHAIEIQQRGKGLAVKKGALASSGEIIFLCDADLSMPPDNLARFVVELETADVVVGSREAPGSHRYNEPWHRHFMGRVFNTTVRFLAVRGIDDTQCGFKAFRRAAAVELFERQMLIGFGFDVELLYLAQKYGYTVKELGIDWYFDHDTRVRPGVDTVHMLGELLMIRFRDTLGHYRRSPRSRNDRDSVA
jgi:dolichyl-phosphate beta-glucosyltransferase